MLKAILWEVTGVIGLNRKYVYEVGKVYNKVRLLELKRENNVLYAIVECIECKKQKRMKSYELFNRKTNSCRCTTEKLCDINRRVYAIYHNMRYRCLNPNCRQYKNYGGRGIKICDEWLDTTNGFNNFYVWAINNGYADNLTIDRIEIDGNYEPNNCRFITKSLNTALSNIQHPRIKKNQ